MKTVLITGGSGLVGTRLSKILSDSGYRVTHLSRSKKPNSEFKTYQWNIENQTIDQEAISTADTIIHLAGAGIVDKRWTDKRKQLIISSRTKSTQLLQNSLLSIPNSVKSFISASAIGFYGNRPNEIVNEDSDAGSGFLSESCIAWEKSVKELSTATQLRTVKIRIGIVLSTQGGALGKMLPSYSIRVGSYFGNGSGMYSWIHIDDLCRIFIYALENNTLSGIYNGVAPHPVSNKTFAQSIANAKGISAAILPAPVLGIKLAMGEMSHVVLDSVHASSEKLAETGFTWNHPKLIPALQDLFLHSK